MDEESVTLIPSLAVETRYERQPPSNRKCILISAGLVAVLALLLMALVLLGPAAQRKEAYIPPSASICPPDISKGTKHFVLYVQQTSQAFSYNNSINGPLIDVTLGDDVSIDVINNSSVPTSVHWHGQNQNGTSWVDGVAFFNQVPIPPGRTFRHRFTAEPAGTAMYHSHTGMTFSDGLRGSLIVRDPRDPWLGSYEEERILMMTDPLNTPSGEQLLALQVGIKKMGGTNPCLGFTDQDFSDADFSTLLTNGKGWNQTGSGSSEVIRVQKGKRYRLRFINAAASWGIKVNISSHSMDVISISGGNIVRSTTQAVVSTSGDRFDVILTADQQVGNYWIHVSTLTGLNSPAILSYEGAMDPLSDPSMKLPPLQLGCQAMTSTPSVMDLKLSLPNAHPSTPAPPTNANQTLAFYLVNAASQSQSSVGKVLGNNTNILGLNMTPANGCALVPGANQTSKYCWNLNWIGFDTSPNGIPFLFPGSTRTSQSYVQRIALDSVVDLVMVNIGRMVHPMHLHGHRFWVLGSGNGSPFLPNSSNLEPSLLNQVNPGLRDTFDVPQSINGSSGWAVLRFQATNPGVWPFHCHIDLHAASGMIMAFQVDGWSLPRGIESCFTQG